MPEPTPDLEARLAELSETVRRMDERIAALERARVPAARRRAAPAPRAVDAAAVAEDEAAVLTRGVALAGRSLLVLAGGFLLRALTDSGTLPAWLGVGLGLAYAGAWIALADRAAPAQPVSATVHGLTATLVGFPLLFEATARFRLLSPAAAALLLGAFTAVALAAAARRRLEPLAWIVSLGGAGTALALALAAGRLAPPLLYLVALGVATLWLGYVRDWFGLRWPVAALADLAALLLALRAARPDAVEGAGTAMFVLVVLVALYLGSVALRTLLLGRDVVPFEVAQTAAASAVGLGGASWVAARSGVGAAALGAAALAIGVAAYAVAFAFLERRGGRGRNFHFYTSVALLFVLAGTGFLLPGEALAVGWAGLAVGVAVLARALRRRTLSAHAAAYALAAALAGGVLAEAARSAFAAPELPVPPGSLADALVVAALAATAWLGARDAAPLAGRARAPRLLLVAALATGVAGLLLSVLLPPLAGRAPGAIDAGAGATVRTAVLVAGALALAALGRAEAWREAGWLAYPLLGAVALKFLVHDVGSSRPATLFVAFALLGAGLLVVPRLRRRERADSGAAPPAAPSPQR